jgi:hypothetical protein
MARTYDLLGAALLNTGDIEGSRTAFTTGLEISQNLYELDPQHAQLLIEALRSIVWLSDRTGDLPAEARRAAAHACTVATAHPADTVPLLPSILTATASILERHGDPTTAHRLRHTQDPTTALVLLDDLTPDLS